MRSITAVVILLLTSCRQGEVPGQQPVVEEQSAVPSSPAEETGRDRLRSSDIHIFSELGVPFAVLGKGVLAIGSDLNDPYGMPTAYYEDLYIVLPSEDILIRDLAQLRGRVEIRTPQEALAFCRLRTSPRTYFLWYNGLHDEQGSDEVEIVSIDQIDTDFVFGDERKREALRRMAAESGDAGYLGILRAEQMSRESTIQPAQVRTTAEGYEIRRWLLVEDVKTEELRIASVIEVVGRDGHYLRKASHLFVPGDTPGVSWAFPLLL